VTNKFVDSLLNGCTSIDSYQERAWYDNHRFALAPEADEAQIFDDIVKGAAPKANKRGTDPGLTTKNITKLMNPSLWKGMDDSETVRL
jgi:DnaJ homolog subfamily A member 5